MSSIEGLLGTRGRTAVIGLFIRFREFFVDGFHKREEFLSPFSKDLLVRLALSCDIKQLLLEYGILEF